MVTVLKWFAHTLTAVSVVCVILAIWTPHLTQFLATALVFVGVSAMIQGALDRRKERTA